MIKNAVDKVAEKLGVRLLKTPKKKRSFTKDIVKNIAFRLGYEFAYIKNVEDEGSKEYEPHHTYATYSPWNVDEEFSESYEMMKEHTLVDVYRCYELWKLVEQTSKLEEGSIMEVGVWRGGTGALLAKSAAVHGIKDKVYLCDTFTGVVKTGDQDSAYSDGEHSDATREVVEKLVFEDFKLNNVEILEGIFPEDTGGEVEDIRFRLCHIDVDVYQSSKDTVDWIWDRLVPNGIIVFDDYGYIRTDGITRHVNEMMADRDKMIFYNLNGHAVIVKL